MDMYYVEPYFNAWVIKKTFDDYFVFGPFNDEGDAYFICEMFNNKKLKLKDGSSDGEEGIEESYTVYKHFE